MSQKIRFIFEQFTMGRMAILQSSFWTQKTALLTHLLIPVGCERGLGCFNYTKRVF